MPIKPFKNRDLDSLKEVKIYRNLNARNHNFSIKQNNKVVGHTNNLTLENCQMIINRKAQIRIRKNKKKEVHAFICGTIIEGNLKYCDNRLIYNPYINDEFKDKNGDVFTAKFIQIINDKVYSGEEII